MKLRFDNTVTTGSLLQLTVLTTGLVGAWFDIRSRVADHERRLVTIESIEQSMITTQADIAKNLSVLTAIVNERTHSFQKTP